MPRDGRVDQIQLSANSQGPWSAQRPFDFTPCFIDSVILMIPVVYLLCVLLLAANSFTFTNRIHNQSRRYFINQMLCSVALVAVSVADVVLVMLKQNTTIELVKCWLVMVAMIINLLLHWRFSGSRSRKFQLILFWMLWIAACVIQLKTLILISEEHESDGYTTLAVILGYIIFATSNVIWEHLPNSSTYSELGQDSGETCPESGASFFSRIAFSWLNPLMKSGYFKPLTAEDLWNVNNSDRANVVGTQFAAKWQDQLRSKNPSFTKALWYTFGGSFMFAAIGKLAQDLLAFVQPQLLSALVAFVASYNDESVSQPMYLGYLIAASMFLTAMIQSCLIHQYFHRCIIVGMHVRSAIVTAVYKKSLVLSNASRQASTVGEIVNLMSVDAQRLMDLASYLHLVWSSPLQIALALVFLYNELGPSAFAGLGIMVFSMPVNAYLAYRFYIYQKKQMTNKDQRIKTMDEVLNGIKVIKLYSWESLFLKKVSDIRDAELETLKTLGYLGAAQSFFWNCIPFLVSFATFALYAYVGDEPLNSQKVFVAISLFNLLRFPLFMLPEIISAITEASVSVKRLRNFLTLEEIDERLLERHDTESSKLPTLEVKHGSFKWMPDSEPQLHDISIQMHQAQLLAVVGQVGSGKSSLLSAILGEMYTVADASVTVRGSVAYVGQQAWIMNSTLRDNITFFKPFNQKLYERTIEACGLSPDIEILPGKDLTEIGERGINLSGGQRQRVSLARAVYAQSDIYLFDDPLSAVDAHVGRHIFEKVIGPRGVLAAKTRIFVSHSIQYWPYCDRILMMDDGKIVEGPDTFGNLMKLGEHGQVCRLVNEYTNEKSRAKNNGLTEDTKKSKEDMRSRNSTESTDKPLKDTQKEIKSLATDLRSKIIVKEESGVGSVSLDVYITYFKSCALWAAIATLVVMTFSQASSVGTNIWLKDWAESSENGDPDLALYLGVYAALGAFYAFTIVVQVILVMIVCAIRSARKLHSEMLHSVLRSPTSFFDTTPLGRIVNRFSKDMYTIDEVLPRSMMSLLRNGFTVLATFCVIIVSTPLFLVFLVPMVILYYFVRRYYIATSRELKRLDSVSRSPICRI